MIKTKGGGEGRSANFKNVLVTVDTTFAEPAGVLPGEELTSQVYALLIKSVHS